MFKRDDEGKIVLLERPGEGVGATYRYYIPKPTFRKADAGDTWGVSPYCFGSIEFHTPFFSVHVCYGRHG